jgi:hypothetical protein
LLVPAGVASGEYELIGRTGVFPDRVVDEESFDFQVIE